MVVGSYLQTALTAEMLRTLHVHLEAFSSTGHALELSWRP